MLFQWDANKYSVRVKDMDDEHIVLIDYMNKLYDRYKAGAQKDELAKLLKEFYDYTVKHFSDEEKFMESIKHQDIPTHKLIHQKLLERFQSYSDDFEKAGRLTEDFFQFLKIWLTAHIQGVDKKYSPK